MIVHIHVQAIWTLKTMYKAKSNISQVNYKEVVLGYDRPEQFLYMGVSYRR